MGSCFCKNTNKVHCFDKSKRIMNIIEDVKKCTNLTQIQELKVELYKLVKYDTITKDWYKAMFKTEVEICKAGWMEGNTTIKTH
jgi:hypothetical protein